MTILITFPIKRVVKPEEIAEWVEQQEILTIESAEEDLCEMIIIPYFVNQIHEGIDDLLQKDFEQFIQTKRVDFPLP